MEELKEEMEGGKMRREDVKGQQETFQNVKTFPSCWSYKCEKSPKLHDFQSGHKFVTCQQRKQLFYFRIQTIYIILLTYFMCFNSEHSPQLLYLIFSKQICVFIEFDPKNNSIRTM